MDAVKTLTQNILINGQPVEVKIEVYVIEDDEAPDDDFDFGDAAQNAEYLERFTSGELFVGTVEVRASALGIHGADYLSRCHLHSNNYFDSEPFLNDVNDVVYEHDMVATAVAELVGEITEAAAQFAPFMTVIK